MKTNRLGLLVQGIRKSAYEHAFLRNLDLFGELDVEKQPFKKSDLVYICITTIARACAQVPVVVAKRDGKGEWDPVDYNHELSQLLRRPNERMNCNKFMEIVLGYFLLDGDIWIYPYYEKPTDKFPKSLEIFPKSTIKPSKDEKTGKLVAWNFYASGIDDEGMSAVGRPDKVFSPLELIHIWLWNPYDSIMGLSPLKAGKIAIDTDYQAQNYSENFFKNGAVPGIILSIERKLTEQQRERLMAGFEDRHKGVGKAGRTAIAEGGVKVEKIGLSQRDMNFPELRELNRTTILNIYGIKPAILGEKGVTHATAKLDRKNWWFDTNIPLMSQVAASLNFGILRNIPNLRIGFDYSSVEALQDDYRIKVNSAKILYKMGFTPNEINESLNLGYSRKPWRDFVFIPANQIPIGEGIGIDMFLNQQKQQPKGTVEDAIEDSIETINETDSEYHTRILKKTQPFVDKAESKYSRLFFEIRKKVLEHVLGDDKTRDISFSKEAELSKKLLESLFHDIVITGINSACEEKRVFDWSIYDEEIKAFIETKTKRLGIFPTRIAEEILKRVAPIKDGIKNKDDLSLVLKKEFNACTNKLKLLCKAEVMEAFNFGRRFAFKRLGVKNRRWLCSPTCALHKELADKELGIEEKWVSYYGRKLAFPCDFRGNHFEVIECTCIEQPKGE